MKVLWAPIHKRGGVLCNPARLWCRVAFGEGSDCPETSAKPTGVLPQGIILRKRSLWVDPEFTKKLFILFDRLFDCIRCSYVAKGERWTDSATAGPICLASWRTDAISSSV